MLPLLLPTPPAFGTLPIFLKENGEGRGGADIIRYHV